MLCLRKAAADQDSEPGHRRLHSNDRGVSLESATTRQRARLKPVKTRPPDATHPPLGERPQRGFHNIAAEQTF